MNVFYRDDYTDPTHRSELFHSEDHENHNPKLKFHFRSYRLNPFEIVSLPIKTVVWIEVNPNFWFCGNESFFEVDDDILIKLHYLKLNICIIDTAEFILKPLIKTLESEGNLNLETFS